MFYIQGQAAVEHRSEITAQRKNKTNDLSTVFPEANLQLHANTDLRLFMMGFGLKIEEKLKC